MQAIFPWCRFSPFARMLATMSTHQHRVGRPRLPSVHTTRNMSVRFTDDERAALAAHAELADRPVAAFIRDVLEKAGVLKLPRGRR